MAAKSSDVSEGTRYTLETRRLMYTVPTADTEWLAFTVHRLI